MSRIRILHEEDTDQDLIDFVVVYYFGSTEELDDSMDNTDTEEVTIQAPSIDIAVRYAQQHIRKMQFENVDLKWNSAEILSIDRR